MAGAGWSGPLMTRGTLLMDALEGLPGAVAPPYDSVWAWPADGVPKASNNHYSSAWSIEGALAALALRDTIPRGAPDRFGTARDVLLGAYFPREFQEGSLGVGLHGAEQFAPDNHSGQILVGPTLSRIAAVLSSESRLHEQSGRLLRTTAQALLCVASPDLQVWSAGMRPIPLKAKGPNGERLYKPPFSGVAGEWLRELLGEPHGRALNPELAKTDVQRAKVAANWVSPQYLAVRGLGWLLQGNDPDALSWGPMDLQPVPCALKLKMTVWRSRTGHLSVIDKSPARPGAKPITGVCDWLWVPYPASAKTVVCGFDWQTEPPTPPHGAQMLIFPGR